MVLASAPRRPHKAHAAVYNLQPQPPVPVAGCTIIAKCSHTQLVAESSAGLQHSMCCQPSARGAKAHYLHSTPQKKATTPQHQKKNVQCCARSGPHTMWVSPSMHELHTLPTSSRGVPKACSRTPTGPVTPQCSLTPTTARGQKKSDVESSHTMSQGTVEAGYVHQGLQANCYQESIWGATALCARLEVPAKQL